MASGNGDPVYGLVYSGNIVPMDEPLNYATPQPIVKTVFNISRMCAETITRMPGDDHYTTEGNAGKRGDLYHE